MEIIYKNTKINYTSKNIGENAIVFLHGWGGNSNFFMSLSNCINDYQTKHILIDFPPFGRSEEPKQVWTLEDYANCLYCILQKENIKKIIIIAHSFGGRVAICFDNIYTNIVQKMIVTSGAGIKPKKSLKRTLKKFLYKVIRFFNKNANLGSSDYKQLSPTMKKTFSNIVEYDLSELSKNIVCPTLLIYGNKDKQTPMYMAKTLNKNIKNSKLIIFKGCGHFAYIEKFSKFVNLTQMFIKE